MKNDQKSPLQCLCNQPLTENITCEMSQCSCDGSKQTVGYLRQGRSSGVITTVNHMMNRDGREQDSAVSHGGSGKVEGVRRGWVMRYGWVFGCGWSDIITSRRGRKSTDEVDTHDLVEAWNQPRLDDQQWALTVINTANLSKFQIKNSAL